MKSIILCLILASAAFATPLVNINTAANFSMLGSTISNTGTSLVIGNVGATTPQNNGWFNVYEFPV